MKEERKTKEINGKEYIYNKSTLLTDIWVPLNENGEPIKGQWYNEPKNKFCFALVSLSDWLDDLMIEHSIVVLVVMLSLLMSVAGYFAYVAYACRVGLQDGWFIFLLICACAIAAAVCLKELLYEFKERRMVDEDD